MTTPTYDSPPRNADLERIEDSKLAQWARAHAPLLGTIAVVVALIVYMHMKNMKDPNTFQAQRARLQKILA